MPTLVAAGTCVPITHFDRLISIATKMGAAVAGKAGATTSFSASMTNVSCELRPRSFVWLSVTSPHRISQGGRRPRIAVQQHARDVIIRQRMGRLS